MYLAGIPLHRSPASLCILLVPVHGLTSHFDGEEGVCEAVLRRG
jgi:hypothetical protein